MSDFSWMQVVDAGARAISTGSDNMTNQAIVERLRTIYADIKRNAGEESGWAKHFEAINVAADRIVILADAVRHDFETISRLADERGAAREEREELARITNKAIKERDEARRDYCKWVASGAVITDDRPNPAEIARRMGWDCFEKEAK